MRPALPVLAAGTLAAAALLVPTAASADTQSPWLTHARQAQAHQRVVDTQAGLTWNIVKHRVTVLAPDSVMVPFVYTCGDAQNPGTVEVDTAVFQDTVLDGKASAFLDSEDSTEPAYPTFTCDGVEHTQDVVLESDGESAAPFENGTVEVGLYVVDLSSSRATFEHAVVGTSKVRDTRAKVAVTVNATPETTKPGATITVKGTVKRNGKAYKDKVATLYFQSSDGSPGVKVGSARASSKGNLTTKVKVIGPGTYFWTTASTSKTQKGATTGDFAASVPI